MATAETKPVQMHSGKYFPAQDDDYRAPKPSSTPSISSSNLECDPGPDHRAYGSNSSAKLAHIPTSNPIFDIECESVMQPNFQHHKDFTIGWENALKAEMDDLSIGIVNKTAVIGEKHQNIEELGYQTCKKYDASEVVPNNESVKTTKKADSMDEFWCTDDHFMDLGALNNFISKKEEKRSIDLESHWMQAEKIKPWWRFAGEDELASFVAQKSLENLENCDLPHPRTKHHKMDQSAHSECFDQDYFLTSSFTDMQFSSLDRYNWRIPSSLSMDKRQSIFCMVGHSPDQQDQPFSSSRTDKKENKSSISNADPSIAELLEALCHSQTRARKAEKAAQQAETEKKHVILLFLRQASQHFGYKQWFRLLQLQNICLQLRNKDQPITGLFPDVSPWFSCKDRQLKQHKNRRKKHGRAWYKIRKYNVALAVGLGLASAGLLLGWTTGWLFPTV